MEDGTVINMPEPRRDLFDPATGGMIHPISPAVLDEGEFIDFVTKVGVSREWYVLITAFGSNAVHGIAKIEERYYDPKTEANDDFQLLVNGDIVITMMRKRRMTRAEFADALAKYIGLGPNMTEMIRTTENIDLFPVTEDHPVRDKKVLEFTETINDYYAKQVKGE